MSERIAVIGSSNIDLIMQVPRFPKPGETLSGGEFTQTFGGKGANQAVAAARAGGEVSFVSCLGNDRFAESFIERFEEDGIDILNVFQEGGVATGVAMILVDQEGENCISVAPGANFKLTERHVKKSQLMLKEARMVLLQGELHPNMLRFLLNWAAIEEKQVMLNLAPAQPLEKEYIKDVEYLVINQTETASLLDRPIDTFEQVQAAAEELAAMVKGGVIISLGISGSYVVRDGIRELVPAFKVKAVDSTAAGDTYCGALAAALVEGKPLIEAVKFASAAAAIAVTRLGAQISVPRREEIEEMLHKNNP